MKRSHVHSRDIRGSLKGPDGSGQGARHCLQRISTVSWVAIPVVFLGLNGAALWGLVRPSFEGLEAQASSARMAHQDAQGELALLGLENRRLRAIHEYSSSFRIPADLAEAIHDIALEQGLEPGLGFRLVQTESSFRRHAVSDAGAIGYTQILPSTAAELDPNVTEADLYRRDTNLRLGFRYLRALLDEAQGNERLALLAYNRGPGRVQSILAAGGDPANGYARQVLEGD